MASRWNDAREAGIADLSVEQLRERLVAAEELATVFGWCMARRDESPRDRVAYEAWARWYELVGPDLAGPSSNRRLNQLVRAAERRR